MQAKRVSETHLHMAQLMTPNDANFLGKVFGGSILSLIDLGPWQQSVEVEAAEIASMAGFMGTWKSICEPASKCSKGGAI